MKIFISYRRADSKSVVDRLRDWLIKAYGEHSVFRDIESISPGENYVSKLEKETATCDVMLVVIGPKWATMTDDQGRQRLSVADDWTRIEVERGLAHKDILVIPVLIAEAKMPGRNEIPDSICDLVYRNGISVRNDPDFKHDMERLLQTIDAHTGGAPFQTKPFEPETVRIPEGTFFLGSEAGADVPEYEKPAQEVHLPTFRFGKYPVTNKQFAEFMRKKGKSALELGWKSQKIPLGRENHPVTGVSWYDAMEYCRWISQETNRRYTLPNDAQWEKASRGGEQTVFPWGNEFDTTRCNQGQPELAAVNQYPAQNKYGCFDLVGNIRQWTCSLWGTDYSVPDPNYAFPVVDLDASRLVLRILRGSSFQDEPGLLRCSYKCGDVPESRGYPGSEYGFRVLLTEEPED